MAKGSRKKKRVEKPLHEGGKSPTEAFFSDRYGPIAAFIIIPLVTLLVYSATFHYPFVFDDDWYIINNPKIRGLESFLDFAGTRYVGFLSFAVNYRFGGLDVFGYHVVNIAIHITNGLLVWWLATMTFRTPVMRRTATGPGVLVALVCAVIFVSHPVQTQAVTYITQRLASLATLFYLLSLCLYIKARLGAGSGGSGKTSAIYLLSLLSAVLAMKTKEIAFTLPFIIILFDFIFFDDKDKGVKERLLYLSPFIVTLAIIPLSLFSPLGSAADELRALQVKEFSTLSSHDYLMTQFRVIVTYLRLLLLPVGQNLDYDYPLHTSFFDGEVILSFFFLASVFIAAVYLFIRSRRERNGWGIVVSFGVLWFFVTISVESSIVPIRDVIFEHRLYLPSVGAFTAFTAGVFYAFERKGLKGLHAACLLIVISVVLSGAAYKRNLVWKDSVTLWEDVVEKSPAKAGPHNNLGNAYLKLGRMDEAVVEYRKALKLRLDYAEAHYNLALAYHNDGRIGDAIAGYLEAIRLEPYYVDAHYNLANAYKGEDRTDDAIAGYLEAIRLKPDYAEAHINLGNVYYSLGRMEEATVRYLEAIRLKPDYAEAHSNLGSAYLSLGRIDEAIEEYRAALGINPDYAKARRNLANALKRKGLER